MQLLNPLRAWFWRVKLNLIEAEIVDTREDIAGEFSSKNFGNVTGLTEFLTDLIAEAQDLRVKLRLPLRTYR